MAEIYDFTKIRLDKMTPWERIVEIDRQTKRVVTDISRLGVEVRNTKVVPPKRSWVKPLLITAAVVGVVVWLGNKN